MVVSDMRMPGMSGPEFHDAWQSERADTPFLFTSGHAAELIGDLTTSKTRFLEKPFTRNQLLASLRTLADECRLKQSELGSGPR